MSTRKPAVSIERMIDEVFNQEIDDELIEELAEAQTLIRNFIQSTIQDNELWKQVAEENNFEERKKFLELIALTFVESDSNLIQIDLITSKHSEEK
jgi:hypothetical protein